MQIMQYPAMQYSAMQYSTNNMSDYLHPWDVSTI